VFVIDRPGGIKKTANSSTPIGPLKIVSLHFIARICAQEICRLQRLDAFGHDRQVEDLAHYNNRFRIACAGIAGRIANERAHR
jgi:hypothetical protein